MKTETLRYTADGLDMVGHLALPDGASGPRPAVLVFPEAFGLGDHAKLRAERLAEEFGYVALGCDLYGEGKVCTSFEEMGPLLEAVRGKAAPSRARSLGALEALTARAEVDASRVAAIGFCFGGALSYELALAGADLRAAIGFHSGLGVSSPGDAKAIKGKVLTLLGADDPGVPPEARDGFTKMLSDAGVDYTLTLYGGVVHSFTNPEADKLGRPDFARYDANADRRSWAQMADLLAEVFGA